MQVVATDIYCITLVQDYLSLLLVPAAPACVPSGFHFHAALRRAEGLHDRGACPLSILQLLRSAAASLPAGGSHNCVKAGRNNGQPAFQAVA
jgi:hypothetical protein